MRDESSRPSRRGRRPRAEAPATPVRFRLSPEECRRLERAAAVNRQSPADFARDAIVTAAEDCLEDNGEGVTP